MADLYKETYQLKIGLTNSQGDTEYITLDNPGQVTESQIKQAANYLVEEEFLIDKKGGKFTAVKTAYTENKATVTLDLD